MLRFQASIHGGKPAEDSLSVSFDQAMSALEQFDRLFIEPDGSFVWTGHTEDGESWQVDGNLIDRGEFLAFVELKGRCPEAKFDMLLAALGWPAFRLTFQLSRRGIFVDEAEFRALAASETGAV
jgi:hypothetical protein